MTDRSFNAVLFTLLAMVSVAGWQFYSLALKPSASMSQVAGVSLPSIPVTLATQRR
jgi:hypothetical protein